MLLCVFSFFTRLKILILINDVYFSRVNNQIRLVLFFSEKNVLFSYRGIKIFIKYICAFTTLAHTHYTTQFYVYNITNPSSYYHPHLPLIYFRMQQ